MDEKLYEFIIAYASTNCSVQAVLGSKEPENKYWYEQALACKHNMYGVKYGDLVFWNNQCWCSVRAHNAKEALDIFIEKLATYPHQKH